MLVQGIAKCLHCGHIAGQWVGRGGSPMLVRGLRPRPLDAGPMDTIRCRRCRGPVFLDEASLVSSTYRLRRVKRMKRQLAQLDRETRPGRAA